MNLSPLTMEPVPVPILVPLSALSLVAPFMALPGCSWKSSLVMVSLALCILGTHRDRESQLVVEAESRGGEAASQSPTEVG